jgi:hypothetical protein
VGNANLLDTSIYALDGWPQTLRQVMNKFCCLAALARDGQEGVRPYAKELLRHNSEEMRRAYLHHLWCQIPFILTVRYTKAHSWGASETVVIEFQTLQKMCRASSSLTMTPRWSGTLAMNVIHCSHLSRLHMWHCTSRSYVSSFIEGPPTYSSWSCNTHSAIGKACGHSPTTRSCLPHCGKALCYSWSKVSW